MTLYVVGRILTGLGGFSPWYVRGVFDSYDKASDSCVEGEEFIGIVELNKDYGPHRSFYDWTIYHPVKK